MNIGDAIEKRWTHKGFEYVESGVIVDIVRGAFNEPYALYRVTHYRCEHPEARHLGRDLPPSLEVQCKEIT